MGAARRGGASRSLICAVVLLLIPLSEGGVEARRSPRATGPVVEHRAGGKRVGPSSARIVNLKVWDHAGEPTMGVNPGGDLFYVALDSSGDEIAEGRRVPAQVHVFRSQDAGVSWQDISPTAGPQRRHALSLDPYLLVDRLPDGDTSRLFTIDLTVACSYLSFSDDDGETWTTNPLACGRPINDHQTLFAGPPVTSPTVGYPHVVYYCFSDIATSSCSKSLDGGVTFTPTGPPAFVGYDDELCGGLHGHGVVGPDGAIYLPREYCESPMLGISRDEGRTWEVVRVSSMRAVENDPSVAVDDEGNIYYLFLGLEDRLPYLTFSRDTGKTWSEPVMVGVPGLKEASLATLDVGGTGKVAIAYMGSTNVKITPAADPEALDVRDHLHATWNAYVVAGLDVLTARPTFITGQVNTSSDPIKRRTCGPGACGRVLDFLDVVIAPDGTPWATFVDACMDECSAPSGAEDLGDEAMLGHLVGAPSLN